MTGLYPYQRAGADWLAKRSRALLGDEPRVGKTPAAIRAADLRCAEDILEITKGSARRDHERAWLRYQQFPRRVTPVYSAGDRIPNDGVVVTSYDLATGPLFERLRRRKWDAIILDEIHRLKSRGALRTKRVYGEKFDGDGGLIEDVPIVWGLSGTPFPTNYSEIWATCRAVFPEAIEYDGKPMSWGRFVQRYCVLKDNGFGMKIVGNRNADDLRARLAPYMLRRKFHEVWPDSAPPVFEQLYLDAKDQLTALRSQEFNTLSVDYARRLAAAEGDDERTDAIIAEIDSKVKARIQRLTGEAKAPAAVEWVTDRLNDGLEKIVLFAWHQSTIEILAEGLAKFHPAIVHGGVTGKRRDDEQDRFRDDVRCRVFIGQTVAAGEAIDLSVADEMVIVESSWSHGDNDQTWRRIVNTEKKGAVTIYFATLAGSVDERIQSVAVRRAADIAKVLG